MSAVLEEVVAGVKAIAEILESLKMKGALRVMKVEVEARMKFPIQPRPNWNQKRSTIGRLKLTMVKAALQKVKSGVLQPVDRKQNELIGYWGRTEDIGMGSGLRLCVFQEEYTQYIRGPYIRYLKDLD